MFWTLSPPLACTSEESLSDRLRVPNVENSGVHDLAIEAVGVFPRDVFCSRARIRRLHSFKLIFGLHRLTCWL